MTTFDDNITAWAQQACQEARSTGLAKADEITAKYNMDAAYATAYNAARQDAMYANAKTTEAGLDAAAKATPAYVGAASAHAIAAALGAIARGNSDAADIEGKALQMLAELRIAEIYNGNDTEPDNAADVSDNPHRTARWSHLYATLTALVGRDNENVVATTGVHDARSAIVWVANAMATADPDLSAHASDADPSPPMFITDAKAWDAIAQTCYDIERYTEKSVRTATTDEAKTYLATIHSRLLSLRSDIARALPLPF